LRSRSEPRLGLSTRNTFAFISLTFPISLALPVPVVIADSSAACRNLCAAGLELGPQLFPVTRSVDEIDWLLSDINEIHGLAQLVERSVRKYASRILSQAS
jgi:hypothetical protein